MNQLNRILVIIIAVIMLFMVANIPSYGAEVHIVDIPQSSTKFIPEKLTIYVGDTVRWTNSDDSIPKHLFASIPGSSDKPEIDIIDLSSGHVWEHTFNKEGRYPYFCFIHQGMIGEIIVVKKEENKK